MKHQLSFLILLFASALNLSAQDTSGRQTLSFDDGWRFSLSNDTSALAFDYDDSHWRQLSLPHDWSIESAPSADAPMGNDGGFYQSGIGWYRKTFNVPASWADKNVHLYFDGIYRNGTIYVNGKKAGSNNNGYMSFFVDIRPYLRFGSDNVIAVRVDNSAQKNSRWYTGSGIYRQVRLLVTDPLYIGPWGTYITTPSADENSATVCVSTTIVNESNESKRFTLKTTLSLQEAGIASFDTTLTLARGTEQTLTRLFRVAKPQLWDTTSPTLYEATTMILDGDKQIDSQTDVFGIRTIAYNAQQGFLLNGKTIQINGGCIHHDNGILGAAAYRDAEYRKVRLMKEAGFNLVRTSHNPPSTYFLQACDELGLLCIEEAFDVWNDKKNDYDYHLYFKDHSDEDIQNMVRRDRNHPSIIAWSIGNEIIERKHIGVVATAKRLKADILALDATRPITEALCAWDRDWEIFDPHAEVLDIVGYNYMIHKAGSDHARCPERIIWQTESYPREAFHNWAAVNDHNYVIGDIVWTAIDYLGESGIGRWYYEGETIGEHWACSHFPWHGAYCGDIDILGYRKPISYYREMLYSPERNKLYLSVKEPNGYRGAIHETQWSVWPTWESWTWQGHEGKNIDVEIYSRYPRVRLYLNDRLVKEQATTRHEEYKAVIPVRYEPGVLCVAGVDEQGNEVERRTLTTAGEPYAIRLRADRKGMVSEAGHLAYIHAEVVDKDGVVVPCYDGTLQFSVSDKATLLATGSANMQDLEPYTSTSRQAWNGRAMAVVRSEGKAGKVLITATAPGLKKQSLSITLEK